VTKENANTPKSQSAQGRVRCAKETTNANGMDKIMEETHALK